ncbi:MAG: hypothetical protein M1831_005554 [Alyxoria varia]|nr:MAG: hypothetical protein M1831_005554 [Alyxoria varia]
MSNTSQAVTSSFVTAAFDTAANSYDRRSAITRSFAKYIINSLKDLPPDPYICDNACGTGAVTDALLKAHPSARVVATDSSEGMIKIIRENISRNAHWRDRVESHVNDSSSLAFPNAVFDANIMNFGIFFIPDHVQAAREMRRTLKGGGTAVVSCWKETPLKPLLFDAQAIVKPVSPIPEHGSAIESLAKWVDLETLRRVLSAAGFESVRMEEVSMPMLGKDTAEIAVPIAENLRLVIGDQWAEEEKGKVASAVQTVLETQADKYIVVNDGRGIGVNWTAWVAYARK